jgi:hypothetical protein
LFINAVLDIAGRRAVARSAARLWRLEEHAPAFLPLARLRGVWETLLEQLITEPDFEWQMIDAGHIKVHPQAVGARGGNQAMGRTKGGSILEYIWP